MHPLDSTSPELLVVRSSANAHQSISSPKSAGPIGLDGHERRPLDGDELRPPDGNEVGENEWAVESLSSGGGAMDLSSAEERHQVVGAAAGGAPEDTVGAAPPEGPGAGRSAEGASADGRRAGTSVAGIRGIRKLRERREGADAAEMAPLQG